MYYVMYTTVKNTPNHAGRRTHNIMQLYILIYYENIKQTGPTWVHFLYAYFNS